MDAYLMIIRKIAFGDLGLNRIFTETFDFRNQQIELLESNGFVYEGTLRQSYRLNGKFVNSCFHSIIREDEN